MICQAQNVGRTVAPNLFRSQSFVGNEFPSYVFQNHQIMGDFRVRSIKNAADRAKMYRHILDDLQALDLMMEENLLEDGYPKIGAEQEICMVDAQYQPATSAQSFLRQIDDEHYTNELALFNLEINLDPLKLEGNCFQQTETDLLHLLNKGYKLAASFDNHLLLTGILPTLKYRHLQFEYMTPIQRYQAISQVLTEMRGSDFKIYLQGVDELNTSLGSVLFEACNTSFQLHLQMQPKTFVDKYNWAQMITGPVLSACVNSPLLLGKELWAETRIALFKQSLDTRSPSNHKRKKMPRVFFGNNWLKGSPANLWKEEVLRFPLLFTSDDFEESTANLKQGKMPDLRAVRLHNGTTYTWNRLCYGNSKNRPHLRIECRYLPAGPSPVDEIANFAFWIGLMQGQPDSLTDFWKKTDFKIAKNNFIKAARYGLQVVFEWFGKQISAKQLILEELLPIAKNGLEKFQVDKKDIAYYLSIIEQRVRQETTGAVWLVRNYRNLQLRYSKATALQELNAHTITFQKANLPVHDWPDLTPDSKLIISKTDSNLRVEELMSIDIFSVDAGDSVDVAITMFSWRPFHHIPVENEQGEVIGMLTDGLLERFRKTKSNALVLIKEIMIKDFVMLNPSDSIAKAKKVMQEYQLSGIPVTYQQKLVGMLTVSDLNS